MPNGEIPQRYIKFVDNRWRLLQNRMKYIRELPDFSIDDSAILCGIAHSTIRSMFRQVQKGGAHLGTILRFQKACGYSIFTCEGGMETVDDIKRYLQLRILQTGFTSLEITKRLEFNKSALCPMVKVGSGISFKSLFQIEAVIGCEIIHIVE